MNELRRGNAARTNGKILAAPKNRNQDRLEGGMANRSGSVGEVLVVVRELWSLRSVEFRMMMVP